MSHSCVKRLALAGCLVGSLAGSLAWPLVAEAQGVPGGAERGAAEGGAVAGPLGAAVGGVVGGVAGGVAGVLGVDQRPRFHDYVLREHRSSFAYRDPLVVGAILPPTGVSYYAVPPEYGLPPYDRYTIVNGQTVIVDERTHRIVEVID